MGRVDGRVNVNGCQETGCRQMQMQLRCCVKNTGKKIQKCKTKSQVISRQQSEGRIKKQKTRNQILIRNEGSKDNNKSLVRSGKNTLSITLKSLVSVPL